MRRLGGRGNIGAQIARVIGALFGEAAIQRLHQSIPSHQHPTPRSRTPTERAEQIQNALHQALSQHQPQPKPSDEYRLNAQVSRSTEAEGKPTVFIRNLHVPNDVARTIVFWQRLENGIDVRVKFIRGGTASNRGVPEPEVVKVKRPDALDDGVELNPMIDPASDPSATPTAQFRNISIPVGSQVQASQVNFADGLQVSLRWQQSVVPPPQQPQFPQAESSKTASHVPSYVSPGSGLQCPNPRDAGDGFDPPGVTNEQM